MKKTVLILFISCISFVTQAQKAKITSATLGMMEARHIGPAVMGGRITAIEGVNRTPRVVYVGTAGGGIWKTTNAGGSFTPLFDKHPQSIGALAIDQARPDTVWAGTGESNMRNSVSVGLGIYRSTDGGNNWTKMGLENSEHISKIIIHPKDPNTLFVSVPGKLWSDSEDRGLYKTTNGGKTWQKILYVDATTGCADLLMDPRNPDVLIASMWQFRRTPYSFSSGGPSSGLHKSTDGGKTWKKITQGLPTGEFGRIALALAPSAPDNMLAIVEAKNTGLYISADGGETWKEQSATANVKARPFYFSTLVVDPKEPKRVYRPAFSLSISDDGGYSFTEANSNGGWVHSDHHALWINPNNTTEMYLGTDGGVYRSLDKGYTWQHLNNIPVSQFYHVQVDNQTPYNVMGGLQDNGSWLSSSLSVGGIENKDWENVGGGDGFWVQPDMTDPNVVYSEYQGGNMSRVNRKTNESVDIQPYPQAGDGKLRWNWNTPIVASPTNPKVLYAGSQYLYKTDNQGNKWTKISPDLTTNDLKKQQQEENGGLTVDNSAAENHCTVFAVSESPLDQNIIYAGTDDGNLQITTDGGKNWSLISKNIVGVPAGTWVSSIEASRFDKNVVFATFDNHAYGDMKTYAAKSSDMGKTWKLLTNSTELKGFAHKIKEDLLNKDLLWLGTEMGLYVSLDGGDSWTQFKANVPEYVPVRDIVIHPITNDIVLATHGRGILIIDDISPLRNLDDKLLNADVALLPTRPTPVTVGHYGGIFSFPSGGGWVGANSTESATIVYYLKDRVMSGDVKVDIYDDKGNFLVSLPGTKRKGINKLGWNMKLKPPRSAQGANVQEIGAMAGVFGPLAKPGTYQIKLTAGNKVVDSKIELIPDPKSGITAEQREQRYKTGAELYKMVEDLAYLTAQVKGLQDSINIRMPLVKNPKLKAEMQGLHDKLEGLRKEIVATKESSGITGEERLRERIGKLYILVENQDSKPTDSQIERSQTLKTELKQSETTAQTHFALLPKINAQLSKAKIAPLAILEKAQFEKKNDAPARVGGGGN